MKYAIIFETFSGIKYLIGFTNTEISIQGKSSKKYTIELKEIDTLLVRIEEKDYIHF